MHQIVSSLRIKSLVNHYPLLTVLAIGSGIAAMCMEIVSIGASLQLLITSIMGSGNGLTVKLIEKLGGKNLVQSVSPFIMALGILAIIFVLQLLFQNIKNSALLAIYNRTFKPPIAKSENIVSYTQTKEEEWVKTEAEIQLWEFALFGFIALAALAYLTPALTLILLIINISTILVTISRWKKTQLSRFEMFRERSVLVQKWKKYGPTDDRQKDNAWKQYKYYSRRNKEAIKSSKSAISAIDGLALIVIAIFLASINLEPEVLTFSIIIIIVVRRLLSQAQAIGIRIARVSEQKPIAVDEKI